MKRFGICLFLIWVCWTAAPMNANAANAAISAGATEWQIPQSARPGEVFFVRGGSGVRPAPRIRFYSANYPMFPAGESWETIVPVPVDLRPRAWPVKIILGEVDRVVYQNIEIRPKKYPQSSYRLSSEKRVLLNREIVENDWAEIEPALAVAEEIKRWEGPFVRPVDGVITQAFGTVNYVNGKKGTTHRGVDLRAKLGTQVLAAHTGVVQIAKNFRAFGGTIVIDHGWGVHSLYFHLSKILVDAGQPVSRGQKIGLSGNSGISTAPHLHWGMSVHNMRVEPMQWLRDVTRNW